MSLSLAPSSVQGASTVAPKRVGLIAGWGNFPFSVAHELRSQGCKIYGLGIRDHADPKLADLCDVWGWSGLATLGRSIRFFRKHGVHDATMAGKIFKVRLFQRGAWLHHLPDWRALRVFWPHFVSSKQDRKDDTLLLAIVRAFAEDGVTLAPATDYAPELLVKPGTLTKRGPTPGQLRDIAFGWTLAKEMGRLDVGQSVVVKDRAALAVEAIEGTDECIRRAGKLCTSGGMTVVKTAKPQQDMRFDVPTIGVGTLQTMLDVGAKVLAVESEKTILVDQPAFIEFADKHGLVVVALDGPPSV
ncbi:MAG: UDP-2,3-diacylglucosamine diphosphatase LpxI [Pirellulales bacterium]